MVNRFRARAARVDGGVISTDGGVDNQDSGVDDGNDGGGIASDMSLCVGLSGADQEDCGQYLVDTVIGCGGCHGADLSGQEVRGSYAPNLTSDASSGLGDWSDDEIKDAIQSGMRPDGEALSRAMPYTFLGNMGEGDADAIVAYLRTVPAVDNASPGLTNPDGGAPLPRPEVGAAAPRFDIARLPESSLDEGDPDYEAAERGGYIVGSLGGCVDCHTPRVGNALDLDNLLTGGRGFGPPPSPPTSANLTPHADGLFGWTPQMVLTALKEGTDDEGQEICGPMPSGPDGRFAGLTDEDALAIGQYLTSIDGKPNSTGAPYPECPMPEVPDAGTEGADSGATDAGMSETDAAMSEADAAMTDAGAN